MAGYATIVTDIPTVDSFSRLEMVCINLLSQPEIKSVVISIWRQTTGLQPCNFWYYFCIVLILDKQNNTIGNCKLLLSK